MTVHLTLPHRLHAGRRTRGASFTAAATVLAVGAVLTGCGSASTPATPTPTATPAPSSGLVVPSITQPGPPIPPVPTGAAGVPRGQAPDPASTSDAGAVAAVFAADTLTYDTALDRSPFDAQARSARWATPAYAQILRTPLPNTGNNGFTILAQHHGYTTVTVTANHDDGQPPDQLTTAARSFTLTATGHGDSGWTAPEQGNTMYVFLTRTGAEYPWQVDHITVTVSGNQ